MNLLKKIFIKKEQPISSYSDFWKWFQLNETDFLKVVKTKKDYDKDFFSKLGPKLNELRSGFFFLAGMLDDDTAELIITADGNIKNFVFVEELVNAAPPIAGWKFTAFKPASTESIIIKMGESSFSKENISFYANEDADYPDEVDLIIVHHQISEVRRKEIVNGCYIFLDNVLGEQHFATGIDHLKVIGKNEAEKELIPVSKLKDYLLWREKEFVEKNDGLRRNTEKDNYSVMEGALQNGDPLLAVINTDLLSWDRKASHPWIMTVQLKYNGSKRRGFPDEATLKMLDEIEEEIAAALKDEDGYLNIGRQTADSIREIYFACREFRKPSKVLDNISVKYRSRLSISYDIYKDKYWRSFTRFCR